MSRESIIVGNIKHCRRQLNNLLNYIRPKEPRNSEWRWEAFRDEMRMSLRFFDEFSGNLWETEKLKSAQSSLEEADVKLKRWTGNSERLYNTTRGDLAPVLLHCKAEMAYLVEHLPEVSGEMDEIQTEVMKSVVHQEGRMESIVHMQTLLSRMKELTA